MATRKAVQTAIGTLWGRDCMFLDSLSMPDNSTLVLEGTINTSIVKGFRSPQDRPVSGELPYRLMFDGVLALQVLELDTWESQADDDDSAFTVSSFEELVDSRWLASLGGKVTSNDRHFAVLTYDDVIDVICRSYDLQFDGEAA